MSFTSPNPMPPDLCNALLARYKTVRSARKEAPAMRSIPALGRRTEKSMREAKKCKSLRLRIF